MKKLKTEEGITLVSLAVTIIVLVIVARIVVITAVGDTGLVRRSEAIEQNTLLAEQEAQEKINALKGEEKYTEDGTVTLGDENAPTVNSLTITEFTFNSFRVNINVTETGVGIDKIEYSVDDGVTYVMPVENNTAKSYKFEKLKYSKQYNVKVRITDKNGNETIASKVVDNIKIGDYVNYTYDTVANYTNLTGTGSTSNPADGIAQSSTTLKWRILNIDEENGTIDLVSSEPTDNTVYFSGALGYNNGVYLLNDMCAHLYSNSSLGVTARSIDLVDMEKHLTTTGIAARNAYIESDSGTQYGSTKTYTGSYSYYPNLYATQKGAGINLAEGATVTQPDLSGVDPYNESSKGYDSVTTETYTPASGTATSDNSLTVTHTYYYIPINEINYGAAVAVLNNSNYYWVASRYANASSSYADFGLRGAGTHINGNNMFFSNDDTYNYGLRLRPVVSLSSSLLDGTKDASGVWQIKQ